MRTSVRAKLLSLVALSVGLTLLALPLLSWLLRAQMTEETSGKAASSARAYQAGLDSDMVGLRLAVAVLSSNPTVQRAIESGDDAALRKLTDVYAALYPDIDIAFFDKHAKRMMRTGCDEDGPPLADAAFVERTFAEGESVALSDHGCDRTPMPTYLIGRRVGDAGVVVVGLDFSEGSLARAGKKLHIELCLVDPDGKLVNRTAAFPVGLEKLVSNDPLLADLEGRTFVVQPFSPQEFRAQHREFRLLAALDVTQIRTVIRRNLFIAIACIFIAGLIALGSGLHLATVMSRALHRIHGAFDRLKAQEYVKVEGVRTGDEFEELATCFNTMIDGLRERDKLKTTFGKYMTASVMEHLLAGEVQLGGKLLTATIVFSDIRSFTSISEKMEARALVALLNEYFTEMVDAIVHEDGVVDKYIGDAIMAVYGAPVPRADDALRAARAALGMRTALAHLNERLAKRGIKPLHTGIGVHTGEVVAGNIGSERRMEYTVIGDPVNVALQLENATKEVGVAVLISDDTYKLVKDHVVVEPTNAISVKGRERQVTSWSLVGLKKA